jgi:hypothetical protein
MTKRVILTILAFLVLTGFGLVNLAQDDDQEVLELGDVRFPHELHYDTLELECESCHHETQAPDLKIPHQEYFEDFWINCAICHRENAAASGPMACSQCHHGSPTDMADETLSAKVVIHQSCWECHEVGSGSEASRSCPTCHTGAGETEELR